MADIKNAVEKLLSESNGILGLEPAWVARDFLPPGRRLGLAEEEYDVGNRGYICERWLGSVTLADNAVGPEDEGLSYLSTDDNSRITLKDAINAQPQMVMGAEYASAHRNLGRLVKVFDYAARLPYHLHQLPRDARLVGRNSKDEAYYFLEDAPSGPHPETFFGVHPYIAELGDHEKLLPYLEDWDSDLILRHSTAYLNVPGEGFFLPSGIPHAPGTALTLELQEDSDVFAMLQALNAGRIISKELLFKDVRNEDRERHGERVILGQIDWESSGDHYFYENHHLAPVPVEAADPASGRSATEFWIYYNTSKFTGKKLVVPPGGSFTGRDLGVYTVFVWRGQGTYGGVSVTAGRPREDELLVAHSRAVEPLEVRNTGSEDLVLFKFFGPDINAEIAPRIPHRSH